MKSSQAAAFLALAAVGAAHLVQRELHQRQNNHIALAGRQDEWLTDMTTHPELAEPWVPEGMEVQEYVRLLGANRRICTLSLWHRQGLARGQKLRLLADVLMGSRRRPNLLDSFRWAPGRGSGCRQDPAEVQRGDARRLRGAA